MKRDQDHFRACLVGGAIGDALGWPVEFRKLAAIRRQYGADGIRDLVIGPGGWAEITDDTQMNVFTAEGLLRAESHRAAGGRRSPADLVYDSYRRWLYTQDGHTGTEVDPGILSGWLITRPELHTQRAPGNTCLSALRSGRPGTVEVPSNHSKGCGGVMRVAPVGLAVPPEESFRLGSACAALTHGHPGGYLSAGVLARVIAGIIAGEELAAAIAAALTELQGYRGMEEGYELIRRAAELSAGSQSPAVAIAQLGEGWVGDEAIAISLYCALKYQHDFRSALVAAVNHDGDSDSTGAITGNILGAYLGMAGIPAEWAAKVELQDILITLADDLLTGYQDTAEWREKYPVE